MVPHRAFEHALSRIQQCFTFAERKADAEGLAIVGESGTGKTSVIRTFLESHEPRRQTDGMNIPVLSVTVPSSPTVKSLAGVILEALHAPETERGTENARTRQIKVLIRQTSVRVIVIDEFQHFFDRSTQKIMHSVADWLKILIDETQTTLVVAGLPSCMAVIDQNEQLARRFSSPIRLSRFDWRMDSERDEFIEILRVFDEELRHLYDLPRLHSEDMAFRIWQATGGLMGYLSKLFRHVERDAIDSGTRIIGIADLDRAHIESIWMASRIPGLPRPFANGSSVDTTKSMFELVNKIGRVIELPTLARQMRHSSSMRQSVEQLLTK